MDIVTELANRGVISPPKFLPYNINYLCMMGSVAYGVNDDTSDVDVYGFCTPPPTTIFPHLNGEIPGFGTQKERFDQWQQHHVVEEVTIHTADGETMKVPNKEYDFSVYNIVRYFHLIMTGNPNMVDSLFVPRRCVLHTTAVGELVRENRKLFLHKGCWPKFKGYAYSQMHKMTSTKRTGKRAKQVEEHGYDLKFAYHVVRLLAEVEQIMTEGDLDLERNREQLKAIRRGAWTLEQVQKHFTDTEARLEEVYTKCELPWGPDEEAVKALLVKCLRHAHSDLVIPEPDKYAQACAKMRDVLDDLAKSERAPLETPS